MNTYHQQFWSLRQNPEGITNQKQMRDFILSQNTVTCPFGHLKDKRDNVIRNVYNEEDPTWKSRSQDRKFIEHMNIGDIVVIPFAGIKKCIIARIVSEPLYGIDTKLFTSIRNEGKEIQIKSEGDTPFRPVGRKIQIILKDAQFKDKRKSLSRSSFQPIDSNILNQIL